MSKEKMITSSNLVDDYVDRADFEYFHDQTMEPYIRTVLDNTVRNMKIGSQEFNIFVSKDFKEKYGTVLRVSNLKDISEIMMGFAVHDGQEFKLDVRIIKSNDNSIYYDLGLGKLVHINVNGWEIIDPPYPMFKKFSHQKEQSKPLKSNKEDFENIDQFINIENEEQKYLFKVNLITCFIPGFPHPIEFLHGEQGSAKSTLTKIKKSLIDPSVLNSISLNKDNELIQAVSHHYYPTFDNLSVLKKQTSDLLCRFVTGEGYSRRKLYTDDDDIIYQYMRCITLNGINQVATQPDLLDRGLIFELKTILPENRKCEQDIFKKFEDLKPKILGSIFSIVSASLKEFDSIILENPPRMADFTKWGCAVSKAMGLSEERFLNAYRHNTQLKNNIAIESSPIALPVIELMKDKNQIEITATELYYDLKAVADTIGIDTKSHYYPKDPNWLWRRLKEIRPNLLEYGIQVDKIDEFRNERGRLIRLEKLNGI